MKLIAPITLLTATTLLTACGGNGSTSPLTLEDINTAAEDIFIVSTSLDDETIDLQSEADLIAKGAASYEGFILADVEDTEDNYVGRTSLQVTFTDGGSLTGKATDFVTYLAPSTDEEEITFEPLPEGTEVTEIDGSLTFSGGALNSQVFSTDGIIAITMEGEITIPADLSITENEEVYTIDGALVGAVTENEDFLAEGTYTAESSDAGFDGFAAILAN